MNKIKISPRNSKLGNIPNISLIPVKDCANCGSCKGSCYALKAWKQYPAVRKAWSHNSRMFHKDINNAIDQVNAWIQDKQPEYFRWNVAGDILNQEHLDGVKAIARNNPGTRFLIFTKRHELTFKAIPDNLSIVLSMFPGMKQTRKGLAKAWLQDGSETRIPDKALKCAGSCVNCKICFYLNNTDSDVYFDIH